MTAKGTPSSWLGPLKFKVDGATVQLQPKRAAGEKVQTLILDLRRGTVQLSVHAQWLPDSTPVVHGVLGFVKLSEGALLALITKCKRVREAGYGCAPRRCIKTLPRTEVTSFAVLPVPQVSAGQDEGIFHVTETHLVAHEATKTNNDDIRCDAHLHSLRPSFYGHFTVTYVHLPQRVTRVAPQVRSAATGRLGCQGRCRQPHVLLAHCEHHSVSSAAGQAAGQGSEREGAEPVGAVRQALCLERTLATTTHRYGNHFCCPFSALCSMRMSRPYHHS